MTITTTIATIADLARAVTGLRPDLEYHYERHEIRAAVTAERTVRYEDHDDDALAALADRVEKRLGAEGLQGVAPVSAPSTLESVVAAAARAGDPSDPDTLRRAADRLRGERMTDDSDPIDKGEADAIEAARTAADARIEIEAASRAVREALLAVAHAAGEWYDVEVDGDADQKRDTRDDLRAAVERWRAAGDAFMRAVRGGA